MNSRGGSGTATGTTSWTASGIRLKPGTNVLTVTARDAAGNIATRTLTVTLSFKFSDDPLAPGSTPIKAMHLTELRTATESVGAAYGLATFNWTDPTLTPGLTNAKVVHLTELRSAMILLYQTAGQTLPPWSDPTVVPARTVIDAGQINELRTAVNSLR